MTDTQHKALIWFASISFYLAAVTWMLLEIHRVKTPPRPYEVALPVPFVDPPGVTPQMRIDQTWECLKRSRRCE